MQFKKKFNLKGKYKPRYKSALQRRVCTPDPEDFKRSLPK